jgi:hypothetical protein
MRDIAAARSLAVTKGSFVASAHRELTVTLIQSQGIVCRSLCTVARRCRGAAGVASGSTPFLDSGFCRARGVCALA